MNIKRLKKQMKGQALVEFVLVLPFLLLLFLGMIEASYAMYDYIVLANANREGARLAARGRFDDSVIHTRIVGAGGFRNGDVNTPNLSVGENFGMIITHLTFPSMIPSNWHQQIDIDICCQPDCPTPTNDVNLTRCIIPGSVIAEGDTIRDLAESDSHIINLRHEFETNVAVSDLINDLRESEDFDPQINEIVLVETFMVHATLLHLPGFVPIDDPMSLYFSSSMRVTLNSRTGTQ